MEKEKKTSKIFSRLQEQFNETRSKWKTKIKSEPKKFKRFWLWIFYFMALPFVWLFFNLRDWRTAVCFAISTFLVSSSVWIWYALAIFTGVTTDTAKYFAGIGTSVFLWWAGPFGSPFNLICLTLAIAMKAAFEKIKESIKKRKDKKKEIENKEEK